MKLSLCFLCTFVLSFKLMIGLWLACEEWSADVFFLNWQINPLWQDSWTSWVLSTPLALEAVRAQRHLSRKVSPAGTQSAMGGAGASAAEQQRFLLEAALSTPRTVGGKQVVHTRVHAGAANPKTGKNRKSVLSQKVAKNVGLALILQTFHY